MSQETNFNILVIDDNQEIHKDFIKILTRSPDVDRKELSELASQILGTKQVVKDTLPLFKIDTASQGQEGVEKIIKAKQDGRSYALAFVDVRMPPGWDGIETIKHIWEIDPDMQIVICTAYSDYTWEETIDQLGQKENLLILKKPFDNVAVRQLSCALTKKWQLLQESHDYTTFLEDRIEERTSSLKQSLSVTRGTLESSEEGILVTDNNNKVIDYNKNIIDMWKISSSILEKKDISIFFEHIANQLENPEAFLSFVKSGFQMTGPIKLDKIKSKEERVFDHYSQSYKKDEIVAGRIWSFRDITQRATLESKVEYQATHDSLTGLPNRLLLMDHLHQEMLRSKRENTSIAVLFFDLDRFKLINDSLSHSAGDKLLKKVSNRLKKIIRGIDTLARLGGDEFIVLITSISDLNSVQTITSKLLETFHKPFIIDEHEITMSPSIGISIYPQNGESIDELLKNADSAMYHSKELGGNTFTFYNAKLNQKMLARLEMETDLHKAIEKNEFILHYQPQLDLASNELVSVEALVRWQHPTKGLILPLDFIPLAEETGLITTIGEWVIREACKQNKLWQDQGYPHIRIAINLASKQLKQPNLTKIIGDILQETQLKPECLEIELTENVIINCADSIETIAKLKTMGIQLTLDDFGTGYSGLNYLRDIAIDRIKIDRSFVNNININHGDEIIIQAILSMAKELKLEVLAEGIETSDQVRFLTEKKCAQVQGFYFSKALTASGLEDFIKIKKIEQDKKMFR
jgi:diguanylate cyclase (GGDEF)-like protein